MKVDYSACLKNFTGKGKIYYCMLVGLLGVMLIISGDGNNIKNEKKSDDAEALQEYKIKTEKELTDFLASIEGVGEVKVVVSLETGRENVYAQKEKSASNVKRTYDSDDYTDNSTYENEYIIIKNTGEEQPLIEKTIQPEVRGVAISCTGAEDISVVLDVTNTVSVVLDIPTHKICVTKMK